MFPIVIVIVIACAAACGGETAPLDPVPEVSVDHPDGVWVNERVYLPVRVGPLDVITGLVLEVDGVPAVEIDPMTLAPPAEMIVWWDSATVPDGEHHLRLVATTASGRSSEDSITLNVDNTAPVVTLVGQSSTETPLELQFAVIEEGSGIFQGRVAWGSFDSVPIDRVTLRAMLTGCIASDMTAGFSDVVGNNGAVSFRIDAVDSCDRDCDDVRSVGACGGLDCNDAVASIPDATDRFGDFLDTDCDGVDGTDLDADGIAGSSSGPAPDCDDGANGTYGYWSDWRISAAVGTACQDLDRASFDVRQDRVAIAYTPWGFQGVLDLVRRDASDAWIPATRVTSNLSGENDVELDASGSLHLAFSRTSVMGPTVDYVTDRTGALVTETVGLGRFRALTVDGGGAPHIILEGNGDYRPYHARRLGGGWQVTAFPLSPGLSSRGALFTQNGVVTFVHTDSTGIRIDRFVNDAWEVERVTVGAGVTFLNAAPRGDDVVVAVAGGSSNVHLFGGDLGPYPGQTFSAPPWTYTSLVAGPDGRLHLTFAPASSGSVGRHHVLTGGAWHSEPAISGSMITGDENGRIYAIVSTAVLPSPFALHLLEEGAVRLPPSDPVGDGIDQDCDGVDG